MRFEILSDHNTCWINGADGSCIGRFGRRGIDVHRPASEQLTGDRECLFCTHGTTGPEDWSTFCAKMLEHHAVAVTDDHRPRFLPRPRIR